MQLVETENLAAEGMTFDDDHQKLVELTDQLGQALDAAAGTFDKQELSATLNRLEQQTSLHCEREERHFFQTGFSCRDTRRQEHIELIARLSEMMEQFHQSNDPRDALEIAVCIHDWVAGHLYGGKM